MSDVGSTNWTNAGAWRVRYAYVLLLLFWIAVGDLFSAWWYGGGVVPEVAWIRPLRDATVLIVAAWGLATNRMPGALLAFVLAYFALAGTYLLAALLQGAGLAVVIPSLGTVIIAPLFFLVGHHCLRHPRELVVAASLVVGLGVLSTAFGFWDIGNTAFWTETIRYPAFYADIKGVRLGADPESGLPWNFYLNQSMSRRAAGLLAAPLAQGSFLIAAGLIGLGLLQRRRPWAAGLLLCFAAVGIYWSGTRGAMLAGFVALLGYLVTGVRFFRRRIGRVILLTALLVIAALVSGLLADEMIEDREGSNVGHREALLRNINDIDQVWLLGCGLGCQGPAAGQLEKPAQGGGEGAIFSIAYQMGVPGALLFLGFLGALLFVLWRDSLRGPAHLSLALFWVGAGLGLTLVSSDHMLSVSGMAAFWILCGGAVRNRQPAALVARGG